MGRKHADDEQRRKIRRKLNAVFKVVSKQHGNYKDADFVPGYGHYLADDEGKLWDDRRVCKTLFPDGEIGVNSVILLRRHWLGAINMVGTTAQRPTKIIAHEQNEPANTDVHVQVHALTQEMAKVKASHAQETARLNATIRALTTRVDNLSAAQGEMLEAVTKPPLRVVG